MGRASGQGRYTWNEEKDDRGNALAITAGAIFGVKKSRYDNKDFSVIAWIPPALIRTCRRGYGDFQKRRREKRLDVPRHGAARCVLCRSGR
ncbi:MAG: hypothetical protein ACLUPV_07730 [Bilophila wadsworthia]